jgi:hypothetical protein
MLPMTCFSGPCDRLEYPVAIECDREIRRNGGSVAEVGGELGVEAGDPRCGCVELQVGGRISGGDL